MLCMQYMSVQQHVLTVTVATNNNIHKIYNTTQQNTTWCAVFATSEHTHTLTKARTVPLGKTVKYS